MIYCLYKYSFRKFGLTYVSCCLVQNLLSIDKIKFILPLEKLSKFFDILHSQWKVDNIKNIILPPENVVFFNITHFGQT